MRSCAVEALTLVEVYDSRLDECSAIHLVSMEYEECASYMGEPRVGSDANSVVGLRDPGVGGWVLLNFSLA